MPPRFDYSRLMMDIWGMKRGDTEELRRQAILSRFDAEAAAVAPAREPKVKVTPAASDIEVMIEQFSEVMSHFSKRPSNCLCAQCLKYWQLHAILNTIWR